MSNKTLLVAEGGIMERLSALVEEQREIQLKILTKMNTCSAAVDNVGLAPCSPENNPVKKVRISNHEVEQIVGGSARGKALAMGATQMVAKTIYNFRQKSREQIQSILLHEEQQFLKDNPDYQYDNYRYEDGKHGERTIMLIFIKK